VLLREIIAVNFKNHAKSINTPLKKSNINELQMVKLLV
jgi:hypothetical protein